MSDRALVTFRKGNNHFSPYIYIKEGGDQVIACLKDEISILQQLGGGVNAAGRFIWSFSNARGDQCDIDLRNGSPPEAADWDSTDWIQNAPATADVFLVDIDSGKVHEYFRSIDDAGETCDLVLQFELLEEETSGIVRALESPPLSEQVDRNEQEDASDFVEVAVGKTERNGNPHQE